MEYPKPLQSIIDHVNEFNRVKKFIVQCSYCGTQIIYEDRHIFEANDKDMIKCSYCGHLQEISDKEQYDIQLSLIVD